MPFTFAHAAAALPFRRTKLIPSAVVVGCFSPDFEYFLRVAPVGSYGHSLQGLFVLDIPIGLVVYWMFHRYVKEVLWTWLPEGARQKVKLIDTPSLEYFPQLALVALSIVVGAATHIVWDSFTHLNYWPYQHWHFLSRAARLPIAGSVQYYKLLQYTSTVFGVLVLLAWFTRQPSVSSRHPRYIGGRKLNERLVLLFVSGIAFAIGSWRTLAGYGIPNKSRGIEIFAAEAVITTISVFWLELMVYGFFRERSHSRTHRNSQEWRQTGW